MIVESSASEQTSAPSVRDARDLQAMLYREIGILAVAAALNVGSERAKRLQSEAAGTGADRQKQRVDRAA